MGPRARHLRPRLAIAFVAYLAFAVAAGSPTSLAAPVNGALLAPPTGSEEQGWDEIYSAHRNVSIEQARADMALQEGSHSLREQVTALAGPYLVQVGVESTDEGSKVFAYVTPDADVRSLRHLLESSDIDAELVVLDSPTMDDLTAISAKVVAPRLAEFPEIVGFDHDGKRGAIVLVLSEVDDSRAKSIVDAIYHPDRFEGASLTYELVGGRVGLHNRGGYDMNVSCTLGFSVKPASGTGAWGSSTASHCDNFFSWKKFGDPTLYPSSFRNAVQNASADVQWSTISPQTPGPKYFGSSTSTPLDVTGTLDRSAMLGDIACHRGKTTGWSCGDIISISYNPGTCSGQPCASEWPRVEGDNLACFGGDSGGPWAWVGTAYGHHTGGATSGTQKGDCDMVWFSPARKVGLMGMQILTN